MFWIVILLLMASRAAFVGPVAALHNAFSAVRLSLRECVVIWWAGLMRGAVSVALVYTLLGGGGREGDATLITTTLVVVIISILGFGAATKPLLAFLMRGVGVRRWVVSAGAKRRCAGRCSREGLEGRAQGGETKGRWPAGEDMAGGKWVGHMRGPNLRQATDSLLTDGPHQ